MKKPKPLNLSNLNQGWRANKFKRSNIIKNRLRAKKSIRFRKPSVYKKIPFLKYFTKKNVFIFTIIIGFIGIISISSLILWLSRGLPSPDQLMIREIAQSTKIFDRTGEELLYEIHGNQKRTLVNLDDIPKYVQQATISIEDKNFYEHKGFSLIAIARTGITNILYGRKAGASTLTQQFIKNSVLTSEKKYSRKIKEFILAYRLEKQFSKDEILQMYLNEIPYGSTSYGVEAASQRYFNKSVKDINLAEAAILAALPQAPSAYSPYGSNRDILIGRQHYILDQMAEQGYITKEEAQAAKDFELVFEKPQENIKAPHFVMYIKEQLAEKYGEKMIEQGGLKIYTTIDLYKQEIAEQVIKDHMESNEENYDATNAALVSINPKNGHILAMVGSRDYFDEEIDGQVNVTTSLRQPGSSMKPLVYATSFLKGYTPDTILYDVVTNFSNDKEEPYEPHNYDLAENGPVSIRKALAGSLNIPAVKAIYLAGVNNVLDLAEDMNYTTLKDRDRYGLALVLGGAEIKLVEHTNAYSAFAREGNINELISILKIEDAEGNILEEAEEKESKVMDPKAARMINDVLSDNNARAYAFGTQNYLNLGSRPVAAKTGTTNDYRDAWTIGYTPSIVTGVWVGNNDNSPMRRGAAGGVVAAPIWHDYMKQILGDTPIEYFKEPEIKNSDKPLLNGEAGSMELIKIDKATGLLATEFTPESFIEEKNFLQPHSILHYIDINDPLGDIPENTEKDPQYKLWEEAVMNWALEQASSTETEIVFETPPSEFDDIHTEENIPKLKIISPNNNQSLELIVLSINIETDSKRGVERVEYYLNNSLFSINYNPPFSLNKRVDFLNNGFHTVRIKSCDDVDNCIEKSINFNLNLENNKKSLTKPNISITNPSNGLAVMDFDFPLTISLDVENPQLASEINIYLINESLEQTIIKSIAPIEKDKVSTTWEDIPNSGTYQFFAELISWEGEKFNTDKISISINNTKEETEEDN
ncbi:hypothetical protein C0583_04320 [Candidatus Parcubacteria bacterium]|nr:MAG: hypothetical protein C0583_04320 [Candidatus Parcubacteria bacterium]